MTARHELQVELKKLEGDYEQKLQDLSQEKEQLATSKLEREKENQGLQQQLGTLKQQVQARAHTCLRGLNAFFLNSNNSASKLFAVLGNKLK